MWSQGPTTLEILISYEFNRSDLTLDLKILKQLQLDQPECLKNVLRDFVTLSEETKSLFPRVEINKNIDCGSKYCRNKLFCP